MTILPGITIFGRINGVSDFAIYCTYSKILVRSMYSNLQTSSILDLKHNSVLKTRRIKTSQLRRRVLAVAKTPKKAEETEGSKKSEFSGKKRIVECDSLNISN